MKKLPAILIIGPSLVGKSTFFRNFVNKRSIETDYYPGTKTAINSGIVKIKGRKYLAIDTPGIHNLIPTSENEIITLKLILEYKPEKIILVVNEEHMEHNLLIMIQLAELGIPFVINFYKKNDFIPVSHKIDEQHLCDLFNTKIVHSTPLLNKGIYTIKKALSKAIRPRWIGKYPQNIDGLVNTLENKLKKSLGLNKTVSLKFVSLLLFLKSRQVKDWLRKMLPTEKWQEIFLFLKDKQFNNLAFNIAKTWKKLASDLEKETTLEKENYKPRHLTLLSKYSLMPFWNYFIIGVIFYVWFYLLINFGNRFLVKLFYTEIFGRYLEPFFDSVFFFMFGDSFLFKLFIGPFGLFSVGITYSFAIILPTIFVFFFILSTLDESGFLGRISLSLNKLFRGFGLNGSAFPTAILGSSCKVLAVTKSKILETSKERFLILVVLLLAIPCISQLGIISNLLAIIPVAFSLLYFAIILLQIVIVTRLIKRFYRQKTSDFVVTLPPLRTPRISIILHKTYLYTRWYLKEIVPLLLISTLILFLLNQSGLLGILRGLLLPFVTKMLNLPEQFSDAILFGLFRKDFGAVYLYDLANNGLLNSIQVLVSLVFITFSIPCLSFVLAVYKERGLTYSVKVFVFSLLYAGIISVLVNRLLRI